MLLYRRLDTMSEIVDGNDGEYRLTRVVSTKIKAADYDKMQRIASRYCAKGLIKKPTISECLRYTVDELIANFYFLCKHLFAEYGGQGRTTVNNRF